MHPGRAFVRHDATFTNPARGVVGQNEEFANRCSALVRHDGAFMHPDRAFVRHDATFTNPARRVVGQNEGFANRRGRVAGHDRGG